MNDQDVIVGDIRVLMGDLLRLYGPTNTLFLVKQAFKDALEAFRREIV